MAVDPTAGVPEVYVEAWGVAETLRRSGFEAAEISAKIMPWVRDSRRDAIAVVLRAQGKEFTCIVGQIGVRPEAALATFENLRERIGEAGDFLSYTVWLRTLYGKNHKHRLGLIEQLRSVGFVGPGAARS